MADLTIGPNRLMNLPTELQGMIWELLNPASIAELRLTSKEVKTNVDAYNPINGLRHFNESWKQALQCFEAWPDTATKHKLNLEADAFESTATAGDKVAWVAFASTKGVTEQFAHKILNRAEGELFCLACHKLKLWEELRTAQVGQKPGNGQMGPFGTRMDLITPDEVAIEIMCAECFLNEGNGDWVETGVHPERCEMAICRECDEWAELVRDEGLELWWGLRRTDCHCVSCFNEDAHPEIAEYNAIEEQRQKLKSVQQYMVARVNVQDEGTVVRRSASVDEYFMTE